jgi:hypothetical protein
MRAAAVFGLLVFASACSKQASGLDGCAVSVGTCNKGSVACGVQLSCEKRTIELKCEVPAEASAKTIACQCIENSVLGKKVELAYPFHGDAKAVVATACDLER